MPRKKPREPGKPRPVASGHAAQPPSGAAFAALFAGLGLLALFLAVSLTPLTNNDIWLHLANGRWILEHGTVPLTDPYSFSAEGARFYAHEWLAGVIFHLVHLAAGVTGLILFKTLLGGLAVGGGAALARSLGAGRASTLGCGAVVLVVVNSRFLERPEMFSYALTVLYIWIAVLEHRRIRGDTETAAPRALRSPRVIAGNSLIWWLVPVQWLWVQLHGYFLTGIALIGLFLVGAWAERLWSLWARPPVSTSPSGWRAWHRHIARALRAAPTVRLVSGSVAGLALILVGLLNPNGYEIYTFPFELAGSIFTETIFEWKPTFMTSAITRSSMFVGFCLWLGLLVVGCLDIPALLRRVNLCRFLAVAGLAALLLVRAGLPGVPPDAGAPESGWLWTPGALLLSLTQSARLAGLADVVLTPFAAVHPAGSQIFTLLWLGLAGAVVLRWQRPAGVALAVMAVAIGFILFDAQRSFDAALSAGGSLARTLYLAMPASARAIGIAPLLFLGLTALPALALVAWRRAWPLWQILITAFFLYMAVKQNRNIVNFALVTYPFVAAGLSRTRRALPADGEGHAAVRLPRPDLVALGSVFFFLVALTLASGWPYTTRVVKSPGLGVGPRIPVAAVDYVRANGIGGRVFNKYAYGAYLIHELYPETRVFMDSRNDVYGPELYETYLDALDKPEVTARVFATYRFDYVLTDFRFFPGRSPDRALLDYLRSRPEWILVYFDHTSLLYLRHRPGTAGLIARDGYRAIDPTRYRPGLVATLSPAELPAWETESRRALEQSPDALPARLIRIDVLATTGREQEAMPLVEAVLETEPANMVALIAGARIARRIGDLERSAELYRRVLDLRPELDEIRSELEALDGES